jgi:NAD(P)-dependent dehydrogenase (short-subunit alcohol dehydrogenase family)
MATLRLQGAIVGITGGAGAIGLETAIMFAGAGAHVAIGDIDGDAARGAAALIGERARGYAVDVRDRSSMATFIAAVGAPLVFVNNAGVMPLGRYVDEDPAVTRRAVDVNLWGALHGSRLAARGMIARGEGHIVNIASLMGRMTAVGAVTYGAAKHAIVGFGGGFSDELDGTGVTITTVLPTAVRTPLISGLALGRFPPVVEPYEVAAAVPR